MKEYSDIVLPSGKTATLKKELTAREHEELELSQTRLYKMEIDPAKGAAGGKIAPVDTGEVLSTMRHTLIKTVVVSVQGGEGKDILSDVLDGCTRADYNALLVACRKVANVDETGTPIPDPSGPKQEKNGSPTSAEGKRG